MQYAKIAFICTPCARARCASVASSVDNFAEFASPIPNYALLANK